MCPFCALVLFFSFLSLSLSLSLSWLRAVCPYACWWLVSLFARTVVALSSSWALVRIYKQKNIWITHVKKEREREWDNEGGRADTRCQRRWRLLLLLLLPHVNAQHLCLATFWLPALCTPIRRAGRARAEEDNSEFPCRHLSRSNLVNIIDNSALAKSKRARGRDTVSEWARANAFVCK